MPALVHRVLPLGAEGGMTPFPSSLLAGCHKRERWIERQKEEKTLIEVHVCLSPPSFRPPTNQIPDEEEGEAGVGFRGDDTKD